MRIRQTISCQTIFDRSLKALDAGADCMGETVPGVPDRLGGVMDRRQFLQYTVAASAALLLPDLRGVSARAGSDVWDVPDEIPGDGSANVTEELAAFIRRVPDNATIRFPPGARYRIEETLEVWRRNRLVFDGRGATLFASTPGSAAAAHGRHRPLANRSHLKFIGGNQITVRDLNITGANTMPGNFSPQYNSQHGILLAGVKESVVERCIITNVYGDSIYLGNERPGRINSPCDGVQILENTSSGSGRQGMTLCYGTDIWFVGNSIDNCGFASFDFEPNSRKTPCSAIHVVDNVIGNHHCFLAARGRAPVDDVEIRGNTSEVTALGIQAGNRGHRQGGWLIEGNTSANRQGARRYFGFTCMDDITVVDNDLAAHGSSVRINNCTNVKVTGNRFIGARSALEVRQEGQRWYQGPSSDYQESDNILRASSPTPRARPSHRDLPTLNV